MNVEQTITIENIRNISGEDFLSLLRQIGIFGNAIAHLHCFIFPVDSI
ncbi:hypothetical protein [Argonema galeatum]|nr:hypothetical protein [Argonema galeatum]MCL1466083.1 hypothetical protein [Argonema galeatum A003/A1]